MLPVWFVSVIFSTFLLPLALDRVEFSIEFCVVVVSFKITLVSLAIVSITIKDKVML